MGCRRRRPIDELERFVATEVGGVVAGRSLPGRGAWLCAGSRPCAELAIRHRSFARALRRDLDHAALRRALEAATPENGGIEGVGG